TVLGISVVIGLLLPADVAAISFTDSRFSDDLAVDNVSAPTAIDWLPDGRLLITGQDGRLYRQQALNSTVADAALDLSAVTSAGGETRLLAVAVDPNFASGERFVYLYYTHKQGSDCSAANRANRVSRFA